MAEDTRVLVERLGSEAAIARGCSATEILVMAVAAITVWLVVGGILGWWAGQFQLGLAGAVIAIVITLSTAPFVLQRVKRGRPPGYYQHRAVTWLHDTRLWPGPYIRAAGRWDLGRRLP